jgi:hypothetical protein
MKRPQISVAPPFWERLPTLESIAEGALHLCEGRRAYFWKEEGNAAVLFSRLLLCCGHFGENNSVFCENVKKSNTTVNFFLSKQKKICYTVKEERRDFCR